MSCRLLAAISLLTGCAALAQDTRPHAGMMRFPDISATQIVFSYANDLWIAPRDGGVAKPLVSPPGMETWARFSPDGKTIAFQGNYDGNRDLYTISVDGGVPARVTHHPAVEALTDWTADGRLLFFTNGLAGLSRQTQLFTVAPLGGLPQRLPVPYGANGAISADGEWLAYTPHTRDARTWKRYRGGMATDIWLLNLKTLESRRITDWEGTDTLPMWHGAVVYYLSDAGPEHRLNIWSFDTRSAKRTQLTTFKDYDVKFPAVGPGERGQGEIVLQCGAELYRLDLATGRSTAVKITIPGARPTIRPRSVDAARNLASASVSPTGKRAVIEARGDIWTVPAKTGATRQMTDSSGAAERTPAWSPDGRWLAYLSDADGEYEVYLQQSDGKGEVRQLTDGSMTYYYQLVWSPDSKKLLVADKAANLILIDVESGAQKVIGRDPWASQPSVSWSADARWIVYSAQDLDSGTSRLQLYDTQEDKTHALTSGYFNDFAPAFSRKGDYLYYGSNRDFGSPRYEDVGTTFVYSDTAKLIAVPLHADAKNPRKLEADEETWKSEDKSDKPQDESESQPASQPDSQPASQPAEPAPAKDHGLAGVWRGKVTGLSQMGMPEDEAEIELRIDVDPSGSLSGSMQAIGADFVLDQLTFDEASGAFSAMTRHEGMTIRLSGAVKEEDLSGTWEAIEASVTGRFEVKRVSKPESSTDAEKEKKEEKVEPVKIDIDGFEARGMEVPVGSGSFGSLASNSDGELLYVRRSTGQPATIKIINIRDEKPEEKTVLANAGGFEVSADGKKLLAASGANWAIVDAKAGQSMDKPLNLKQLNKRVDPRAEWAHLLRDAWRRHRDFFYVQNMHGVDWDAVYKQYEAMLADAASREDVSFIIGEMIAELNVGHAYYWGGDTEGEPSTNVGLLGVDYALVEEEQDGVKKQAYRIQRIISGAPWETDARGPLSQPGVGVKEGNFLLAINGRPLDISRDPWAALVGLADAEVTLTVADALHGDEKTRNERDVTVRSLASETSLRFREWIELNRRHVEKQSDGKIGYIYVPNTGVDGQNELFRQFYGQIGKQALIVDERWNGGGQIPTRFIELLNRPRTNYWARRDGRDWPWPPDSNQGPKCMLINGLAGSGGDMFPWLFRDAGLGKLIGTRTWGGLVGITGMPGLIDGGYTAVPTFGFYERDGTWGIEGHGVDPDVEVIDDPAKLARGEDPQLDAAIKHLLAELERSPYRPAKRPADPDRRGMGLPDSDR